MRKAIHWEFCKTLEFKKLSSFIGTNQNLSMKMRRKILWDFEMHTDHPI